MAGSQRGICCFRFLSEELLKVPGAGMGRALHLQTGCIPEGTLEMVSVKLFPGNLLHQTGCCFYRSGGDVPLPRCKPSAIKCREDVMDCTSPVGRREVLLTIREIFQPENITDEKPEGALRIGLEARCGIHPLGAEPLRESSSDGFISRQHSLVDGVTGSLPVVALGIDTRYQVVDTLQWIQTINSLAYQPFCNPFSGSDCRKTARTAPSILASTAPPLRMAYHPYPLEEGRGEERGGPFSEGCTQIDSR